MKESLSKKQKFKKKKEMGKRNSQFLCINQNYSKYNITSNIYVITDVNHGLHQELLKHFGGIPPCVTVNRNTIAAANFD
jgi:hypothetical protein